MKARAKFSSILILIFCVLILSTCLGDRDIATISISVNSAKAAGPVPIDLLRHVIVFSGPTGTQTHTITGSGTVKATVVAGLWNINVTAYDGDEVYATGAASAEVKAGRNTNVTVQMTLVGAEAAAAEAPYQALPNLTPDELFNNWTDLKNYIEGLEDLITPNNLIIERTVMLYDQGLIGGIKADDTINLQHGYYLPSGTEIRVTLVAPTNITTEISRGSSSLGAFDLEMFNLNARPGTKVTFSLGHPDYPQNSSLVLNGAGSANISLINFTGGTTVLNMYRNVTLKNNNIPGSFGGAVTVNPEGTFNMFGGNITGNSASDCGGVYVFGIFRMSGGTISSNSSFAYNGGVTVDGGVFEMSGSAIISGNTSSEAGGVYVYNNAIFDMKGGEIKDNTATNNGGGVYIDDSDFNMSGGEIKNNTANVWGGGVYIYDSDFNMSGGTIGPGNTAEGSPAQGGGVYFYGNDLTMSGNAAITGNKASGIGSSMGGGVIVLAGSLSMSGNAAITGNKSSGGGTTSSAQGGGVYFAGNDLTLSGNAAINGNEASASGGVQGGGVDFEASAGNLNMLAGTPMISDNIASTSGPSANVFGGGVYIQQGIFTMQAGKINGNTANGNANVWGGGVYVRGTAFFTKSGGGEINGHDTSASARIPGNNAVLVNWVMEPAHTLSKGHAVYNGVSSEYRNKTASATDVLDSGTSGPLGGWE